MTHATRSRHWVAMALTVFYYNASHVDASQRSAVSALFEKRPDSRNIGGVLARTGEAVTTDGACAAVCIHTHGCNSFNVGTVATTSDNSTNCELVRTDQHSLTSITPQPGWTLFTGEDRQTLADQLTHCIMPKCITHTCTSDTQVYTRACSTARICRSTESAAATFTRCLATMRHIRW